MAGYKSKRKMRARKRAEKGNEEKDGRGERRKPAYEDVVKKNDAYEAYYKLQKIVPVEEWDSFMETLRDDLPAAFRITSYFGGQAKALRAIVEGPIFQALVNSSNGVTDTGEKPANILKCLPWYPDRLGWQMKRSRVEIRKSESSLRLHNFLISESESGYISRQEAVSMVPPLLLDVKPHHKVLDMCAAPGSKTAQIIELLHAGGSGAGHGDSFSNVSGVVVANDLDNKRCYMLVHQAKRLQSPCFVITNHDAGHMPKFFSTNPNDSVQKELKFDRVLCDAPCSGDGTIRKNYDIWQKWSVANGNNFHTMQSKIIKRGAEMLANDGMLVYSTCSLNPMEDESVVANLLSLAEGGLELIDVSDKVAGLKYSKGLDTWVVMNRDMKIVTDAECIEEGQEKQILKSMFPPANVKEMNLNRCIRILPHLQDTGGFFVAVIRKKVDKLPWEAPEPERKVAADNSESPKEPPHKRPRKYYQRGTFKEDPFFFFSQDEPDWQGIKKFYNVSDKFATTQLMHRSSNDRKRNIYFLTDSAKQLIVNNESHVKFINAGARLFTRIRDKEVECQYRLSQEGLPCMFPYIDHSLVVNLSKSDIEMILTDDGSTFDKFSTELQPVISNLPPGPCVLLYKSTLENDDGELIVPIAGWKGKTTLRPYIAKTEKVHFLRICGCDTTALEQASQKQFDDRKERQQARRDGCDQVNPTEVKSELDGDESVKQETAIDDKNKIISNDGSAAI